MKYQNQEKFRLAMYVVGKWHYRLEKTFHGISRIFVNKQFGLEGFFGMLFFRQSLENSF